MREDLDRRTFEIRRIREAMRYGPEQFREDWDTALALCQLMAIHEPFPDQEYQLEDCMNRVLAYLDNHPNALPWEQA